MIFVTVGTHEQQFNRLIEEIDRLKGEGAFQDDVFIQLGYSTYSPKYCQYEKLIPYEKMQDFIKKSRIVITHGGPSSFMEVLKEGKLPIVCPRREKFDEYVNDHQLKFCQSVDKRIGNIILVENMEDLGETILNFDEISAKKNGAMASNNAKFCEDLEKIVEDIFA